jgi:hypothetical protein
MIDFDLSRRPSRASEWQDLARAVYASDTPEESYWLELKSSLDWDQPNNVGVLARAIFGMANRDAEDAMRALEGSGVIIVGLSTRKVHPVAVIDPTHVENKLSAYLGSPGPVWDSRWVKVEDQPVLVVDVGVPRTGDAGYTLRKGFNGHGVSQTFVRVGSKTQPASEADVIRLARRAFAHEIVKPTLDVALDVEMDVPLCPVLLDSNAAEVFFLQEERYLLDPLKPKPPANLPDEPIGARANATLNSLAQIGKLSSTFSEGLFQTKEEDRSEDAYRAEVSKYLADLRSAMTEALYVYAASIVPYPRFLLSNLSEKNYKGVKVTISVDGDALAGDVIENEVDLRSLLPKRPRRWGRYSAATQLGRLFEPTNLSDLVMPHYGIPSSREIRNGGSFEVDFDKVSLRPGTTEFEVDAETVILIPAQRAEPVLVRWRATATNVDAIKEGEFELPFDGDPLDLVALALEQDR